MLSKFFNFSMKKKSVGSFPIIVKLSVLLFFFCFSYSFIIFNGVLKSGNNWKIRLLKKQTQTKNSQKLSPRNSGMHY